MDRSTHQNGTQDEAVFRVRDAENMRLHWRVGKKHSSNLQAKTRTYPSEKTMARVA